MAIALIILSIIAVIAGIAGSFVPVIPGPPLAWLGLLLAHLSGYVHFSSTFLIVTAIITILILALDYVLPSFTTVNYGGSKAAQRGALIGSIAGMFFGPIGIVVGPFVGAFLGELLVKPEGVKRILKVAFGAFIGFLLSVGIKLIWGLVIAWWILRALII